MNNEFRATDPLQIGRDEGTPSAGQTRTQNYGNGPRLPVSVLNEPTKGCRPQGAPSGYAVCPRIGPSGSSSRPRILSSEQEGHRFLEAEAPLPEPAEDIWDCGELPAGTSRPQRTGSELASRASADERGSSRVAGPVRNRDLGLSRPVPVCSLASYLGPKCEASLREFLPIGDLGLIPAPDLDDLIDREMAGQSVDYTCCLHADWRFGEIEAGARRRVGHQYRGRRHSSLVEIIVKAVYDIEDSLRLLHNNAPGTAVADFWRSWDVQQHIADFCGRLADTETAQKLAGSAVDAALETERARRFVYEQLAAFARQILSAVSPDLPEAPRAGLRRNSHAGRRANQEYNYAVVQVVEGIGTDWRLRLTDVCAALDQNNVPLSNSRKWLKQGCRNWEDVLDVDPEGLTKAIRHRLEWVRHHPPKSHSPDRG